jgi:hypothetical protein
MNAENTMTEFFMLIDKVLKNHPLPPTASDKKLPESLAWAGAVGRPMCLHCKDTIPKIQNRYSQERNCATTVTIPTFMFL